MSDVGFSEAELRTLLDNIDQLTTDEAAEVEIMLSDLQERAGRQAAHDDLIAFCKYMQPDYKVGRHHRILADQLMALENGAKDRVAVNMPPRHGKLVADSTPVLTPTGWTTHGELQAGDYVFHPSGAAIEVLAVSDRAPADYEVEFTNGDTIRCHGAHEWTVYSRPKCTWETHETKWFLEPSRVGPTAGQPRNLTSGNRFQYQLPVISPLEFPVAELPLDPYFMGVWLGDGRATHPDFVYHPDYPQPRKELERRGFRITWETAHKDTGVISAGFCYQGIKQILRQVGVLGNKHIPDIFLRASLEQRLDLLAGLIDTDGHVERDTGRVRIATCSAALKDSLLEMLTGLGQAPYMYEQLPTTSTSGIIGRQIVYYVGFQPTVDIPVQVPHKRITRLAPQRRKAITAIRLNPNGEVGRCIQVDSPDGLYLVGRNLTPTHNSQLVSIYYPAWYIGRNPGKKVMMVSHTSDLAVDFGRKVRNLMNDPRYQEVFAGITLAQDSKSAGRWSTNHGSEYYATGVGSSLAGRGADMLIIDDPHSEQDVLAGNFEVFDKAYQWFTYGARTRLMPGGCVALVQTRWTLDDLTARVVRDMTQNDDADQYEVVEFPAIMEIEQPDGSFKDKALWPAFFDLTALYRTRASMPTFQWNAQYQQDPTAEGSALIKRNWWRIWTETDPPEVDYVIMTLDAAAEQKEQADYTAITTWGVFFHEEERTNNLILLDAVRRRVEYPELRVLATEMYAKWEPDAFIVEKKSSGVALFQELRRTGMLLQEYTPHRGSGNKYARMQAVADIVLAGIVWVPTTRWAEELVEEIASFPVGTHDDLADATVIALTRFRQGGFIRLPTDEQESEAEHVPTRAAYY